MSILIKDIPLGGYEISIMKDGERYRARVDGIWCEVEEIPTTEPDTDTISRQAAIEACGGYLVPANIIKQLPPAQPAPMKIDLSRCSEENWERIKKEWANTPITAITAEPEPKRGKWVFKNDLLTVPTGYWECSECKEGRLLYEENFCPHCGADMKGEDNETD